MKFILSGGGTMGSVSPLIAIYEEIKKRDNAADFLWLATKHGSEDKLISGYGIAIKKIHSGKLRRYFSLQNFIDPIFIIFGYIQSLLILRKYRPDFILTAGGFVAVPVVWAAKVLKIPVLVHQQDVIPGLANKLMAKSARLITVTFKKSLNDFPGKVPILTGNPVRPEILTGNSNDGYAYFNFQHFVPTVLIIGGGTGASGINKLVAESIKNLVEFCQVIHLTGGRVKLNFEHPRYRQFDFMTDQLKNAYAIADLIVSRAGLQTLSEIAAVGKPAIIIPLPGSHQEANAMEFYRNNAVALLSEKEITAENFAAAIGQLIADPAEQANLKHNIAKLMPPGAATKIVNLIYGSR